MIVARVIPVVRSYISYPAGTAKMDPVKFAVYTLAGGAPFTFGLLYLGYLLGSRWTAILPFFPDRGLLRDRCDHCGCCLSLPPLAEADRARVPSEVDRRFAVAAHGGYLAAPGEEPLTPTVP